MKELNYAGKNIYIGLDVHLRSWDFRIMTKHSVHNQVHKAEASPEGLVRYLHNKYPYGNYKCVYESGFSGYHTQERLTELGIETIIVHASDVPTTDKEKRNKTDKIDSTKLARGLRSGELVGIYIPPKQMQKDRAIVRQRYSYASKERSVKNQIKSHLYFMGIEMEELDTISHWSNKYIKVLEQIAQRIEDDVLISYLNKLKRERQDVLESIRMVRRLSKEKRYREDFEILRSIPGVGLLTAMVFLTEIGDVTRFENENKIISYVGLTPTRRSSGSKDYVGRMTKRGNTRVQTSIILAAWMAIRKPNRFSMYYDNCKTVSKKNSNKAIILVSKKLVKVMYAMLRDKKKYKE